MLDAFEEWSRRAASEADRLSWEEKFVLSWEEKYVLQLWLSHLVLAPFDLTTIGGNTMPKDEDVLEGLALPAQLPPIAVRLLAAAASHIGAAGKEREAAVILLVRLVLRPDMRRLDLHQRTIDWALALVQQEYRADGQDSVYHTVSLLLFVGGFIKSAGTDVARPFLLPIFRALQRLSEASTRRAMDVRTSSLAKKAVIKIYRAVSVAAMQLDLTSGSDQHSAELLDDVMGYFLESLGDGDTPVRFAASKAISILTSRLDAAMTADVSEALLDSLKEDVLWEPRQNAVVHLARDKAYEQKATKRRSLAAVKGPRWHGLVLALAQLLYHRAPPVSQLPAVIDALLLALSFEQRSSIGVSNGANVRDAACFGIWALARKYSTAELNSIDASSLDEAISRASILQELAVRLMATAACDPSGNIRRGASAALQELIGRHPDTVLEGIPLVQVVDYHAVALRSRALKLVAIEAAKLDQMYWEAIVNELLGWRGIEGADAQSRRLASFTIETLLQGQGEEGIDTLANALCQTLNGLEPREIERRHGLMLAAAGTVRALGHFAFNVDDSLIRSKARRFWALFNEGFVSRESIISKTMRPDLTVEAVCTLMSALFDLHQSAVAETRDRHILGHCTTLLNLCLARCHKQADEYIVKAASDLFFALDLDGRKELLDLWLRRVQGHENLDASGLGCLRALGMVYKAQICDEGNSNRIKKWIVERLLPGSSSVETRVVALLSLQSVLCCGGKRSTPYRDAAEIWSTVMDQTMIEALTSCLDDHTIDQRGDVGSLVRLEAITVVLQAVDSSSLQEPGACQVLAAAICPLTVEKLDKVRFQAWSCFQRLLGQYAAAVGNAKNGYLDQQFTYVAPNGTTVFKAHSLPSLPEVLAT